MNFQFGIATTVRPLLATSLMVMAGTVWSATVVTENPVWPRPVIVPVPAMTAGVTQTVAVMRDNWKTISNPQGEFWSDTADLTNWRSMSAGGGHGGFGGFGGGAPGGGSADNASNDFRAMKEYIYSAVALVGGTDLGLQALSDARDAVRMDASAISQNGGVSMIINNEWNYPQLGNSNFMKPPVTVGEGYENTVRVRFARTNIAL